MHTIKHEKIAMKNFLPSIMTSKLKTIFETTMGKLNILSDKSIFVLTFKKHLFSVTLLNSKKKNNRLAFLFDISYLML